MFVRMTRSVGRTRMSVSEAVGDGKGATRPRIIITPGRPEHRRDEGDSALYRIPMLAISSTGSEGADLSATGCKPARGLGDASPPRADMAALGSLESFRGVRRNWRSFFD